MISAVVIGTSAGGIDALDYLLPHIPAHSKVPVFVVQHISKDSDSYFIKMLNQKCKVKVKETCHNEFIIPGTVYIAPPDYHLLIEVDDTLSLSVDEKVNFSRPSIDVLFESASDVFNKNLVGIILTGANSDGAIGLKKIKDNGGYTIVQSPSDAEVSEMPRAAIALQTPDSIMTLNQIAQWLCYINNVRI